MLRIQLHSFQLALGQKEGGKLPNRGGGKRTLPSAFRHAGEMIPYVVWATSVSTKLEQNEFWGPAISATGESLL